ncbi:MAG: hypothetical protein J5I94_14560 [Phaeodactylibacter sp.]|nr:hypothetical protein [Phaeodactylibacter sp.]
MKQILLAISMLMLWSCTADNNAQNQEEQQQAASSSGEAATGSFLPPTPPGGHPMAPLLMRDFWVFEFYVVDDAASRAANKGRWFRFFEDGTFESGHWQEKTGNGSWRLQDEQGKVILYLDNVVDAQDGQWEIQGVNKDQDTMTWVGISKTNTAGVICKVINLLTRPTKAQFGVE